MHTYTMSFVVPPNTHRNPLQIITDASIKKSAGQAALTCLRAIREEMLPMSEVGRQQYCHDLYKLVSDESWSTFVSIKNNLFIYCCHLVVTHPLFATNVIAGVDECIRYVQRAHDVDIAAQYGNTNRDFIYKPPDIKKNHSESNGSVSNQESDAPMPPPMPPPMQRKPGVASVGFVPGMGLNGFISETNEEKTEKHQPRKPMLILKFGNSNDDDSSDEKPEDERAIYDLTNALKKSSNGSDMAYFRTLPQKKRQRLAREARAVAKRLKVQEPAMFRILRLKTTARNRDILLRNLLRLKSIARSGGERSKSTLWLQSVESIPFGKIAALPTNPSGRKQLLEKAIQTMEKVTYGQTEVKHELIKMFGKLLTKPRGSGLTVIAIQGPPGVGKTTLIQHGLSKIMRRPFQVIPLGGAVDSSYLTGHDYTYEGSRWGRIIDALMTSGVMNPVLFFEELDKISETHKGQELMNLLMHLTDPCQSHRFQDRYFGEIEFDLSDCVIVFSLNNTDTIPPVLLDRLQLIRVPAFTPREKIEIAKRFLIPSILTSVGLDEKSIVFSDAVLQMIIDRYTSEAGVRRLKECLTSCVQEVNIVRVREHVTMPLQITESMIIDQWFRKKVSVQHTRIAPKNMVGRCCGLWANRYENGGLCPIEVSMIPMPKPLSLELTGSQGKVMQESMRCARTVAWNLLSTHVQKRWMSQWTDSPQGFHIHVPSGAVPKDGPSAGVAVTLAILSVLTDLPIQRDVAFTGEIKLQNDVGIIGGLQAKVSGAIRAGVKTIGFPVKNRKDWDNINAEIRSKLQFQTMQTIQDAIKLAFTNDIYSLLEVRCNDAETCLNK